MIRDLSAIVDDVRPAPHIARGLQSPTSAATLKALARTGMFAQTSGILSQSPTLAKGLATPSISTGDARTGGRAGAGMQRIFAINAHQLSLFLYSVAFAQGLAQVAGTGTRSGSVLEFVESIFPRKGALVRNPSLQRALHLETMKCTRPLVDALLLRLQDGPRAFCQQLLDLQDARDKGMQNLQRDLAQVSKRDAQVMAAYREGHTRLCANGLASHIVIGAQARYVSWSDISQTSQHALRTIASRQTMAYQSLTDVLEGKGLEMMLVSTGPHDFSQTGVGDMPILNRLADMLDARLTSAAVRQPAVKAWHVAYVRGDRYGIVRKL